MKIKVARTCEKRPAKTETLIEEIGVWECPSCHGMLFREGHGWQIEKKSERGEVLVDSRGQGSFQR